MIGRKSIAALGTLVTVCLCSSLWLYPDSAFATSKIIGSLVLPTITGVLVAFGKTKDDAGKQTRIGFAQVTLLIAAVVVNGSVAIVEDSQKRRSSSDLVQRLENVSKELKQNLTLSASNLGATEKTLLSSERAVEGTEKVLGSVVSTFKLGQSTLFNLTGGDTFCHVHLQSPDSNSSRVFVLLEGKYPMRDVHIEINNLDIVDKFAAQFKSNEGLTSLDALNSYVSAQTRFERRVLFPKVVTDIGEIQLPKATEKGRRYNITFTTVNGTLLQKLRLKKVAGQWKTATQVQWYYPPSKKILLKQVDAGFPVEKNGEVSWDN